MSNVLPVPRISFLAAALTASVCLTNASVASAASSSSTQASMGAIHASMSAELLQGPQTLVTSKQTAINKIKSVLTTFFTDRQLSIILEKLAEDAYANKPFKGSFATLISPSYLTPSQLVIISNSGILQTKAIAVLSRRFEPYYNNISKKIFAMKSGRNAKGVCLDQVYVMVAEYLTKATVTPALTEIKSSLTSKEWQSVRTHGATLFLWSKYGL